MMLTESILLEQNKRLREENDELRETVRQLRDRVYSAEPFTLPSGLPYLTRYEEIVLRCIVSSKGIATYERIYEALYRHEAERDPQIVKVMVCRLRKKLASTDIRIITVNGRGYCIGPPPHGSSVSAETSQLIAEALAA